MRSIANQLAIVGDVLMVAGSPRAELRDWSSSERNFTTGPKHKRALLAVDLATRQLLGEKRDEQTATVLPMSLAARESRGFCVNREGVLAFDLKTGERLWQTAEPVAMKRRARYAPTVVVHKDVLLYADRLPNAEDAETFYSERARKYQQRYRDLQAYPMTVAGDKLVVAGPSFELHPSSFLVDPAANRVRLDSAPDDAAAADAAIERAHRGLTGEEDARLFILTKTTGSEEASIPLPSSPVFDGVMAASGRLYICREDGLVSCFGEK